MIVRNLIIPQRYFDSDFPKILKKTSTESISEYEKRVFGFLTVCDSETFTRFGKLIDPDKQEDQKFNDLYHEAMKNRNKRHDSFLRGSLKCSIF